ncbi:MULTISPECIES: hypothetical protein [Marivita]|uniref:Lipoprotein n=1 Tax=Marivita cryptomonadis TaxID=505252 RepID=A0A9Q2RZ49_9RHOB|nr:MULTISPECIES: hypothetical protein [Marivita]MCR9168087.1 hypothetical protein [Paracoccaceae bacterium]MBM2320887.1 hypothetical protein [Marivita cryptomonadis]MBM2330467.1 hypothetical protein [Marivita cryptomonadis]MBM2340054.1 hypothetical protein [Marivita cryptomonadis]MBM2344714.1 hypothetical protein [Marivita cryptomonadis]
MRKLLILATVALTGCAAINESRFNPLNWFGSSQPDPAAMDVANAEVNPLIPRRRVSFFINNQPEAFAGRPIAQITEVLVERRPGGAIIRATGQANRVGPFDVRLIADEAASVDGTLVFDLKALQQAGPRSTNPRARQVTVGRWITDQDLAGIRTVTVRGADNARSVRR